VSLWSVLKVAKDGSTAAVVSGKSVDSHFKRHAPAGREGSRTLKKPLRFDYGQAAKPRGIAGRTNTSATTMSIFTLSRSMDCTPDRLMVVCSSTRCPHSRTRTWLASPGLSVGWWPRHLSPLAPRRSTRQPRRGPIATRPCTDAFASSSSNQGCPSPLSFWRASKWCTLRVAESAILRPRQLGQNPRRLHENPTARVNPQSLHRTRKNHAPARHNGNMPRTRPSRRPEARRLRPRCRQGIVANAPAASYRAASCRAAAAHSPPTREVTSGNATPWFGEAPTGAIGQRTRVVAGPSLACSDLGMGYCRCCCLRLPS